MSKLTPEDLEAGPRGADNDNDHLSVVSVADLADLAQAVLLELIAAFQGDGFVTSATCAWIIRDVCRRTDSASPSTTKGVALACYIADEIDPPT